jgi:hypothetical protein
MPELPQNTMPLKLYSPMQYDLLHEFAARYIWWKTTEEAIHYPDRILAQVMNIGTYEDLGRLIATFPVSELRSILMQAEPGWFTERSWAFWHVRFGLTVNGVLPPPLPSRTFSN